MPFCRTAKDEPTCLADRNIFNADTTVGMCCFVFCDVLTVVLTRHSVDLLRQTQRSETFVRAEITKDNKR